MWIEGIYWCRVVPTTMWFKITYKTPYSKHVRIFVRLALLVLGGGFMCCPNVEAKFRSQYLLHDAQFGWRFFPIGQGDGCSFDQLLEIRSLVSQEGPMKICQGFQHE